MWKIVESGYTGSSTTVALEAGSCGLMCLSVLLTSRTITQAEHLAESNSLLWTCVILVTATAPVYVFNTFRKSEFVNLKKWNFSEMWFWYFYEIKIWRNLHLPIKEEELMGHLQSKFHCCYLYNGCPVWVFFSKILSVFRICWDIWAF